MFALRDVLPRPPGVLKGLADLLLIFRCQVDSDVARKGPLLRSGFVVQYAHRSNITITKQHTG